MSKKSFEQENEENQDSEEYKKSIQIIEDMEKDLEGNFPGLEKINQDNLSEFFMKASGHLGYDVEDSKTYIFEKSGVSENSGL